MSKQNIILGVSGGIAAYKAPELVRQLTRAGAEVQVVMTRSAAEFVTATTLQAVSGRPVRDNLWDTDAEAAMGHIELARWADLVLIAPATAEIMARLASGSAPDLLNTLCLATKAPLAIAPAMNHVMWAHPAVQENLRTLEARGVLVLGPEHGDQACGEVGSGRMLEPAEIVSAVITAETQVAADKHALSGKTVMITAGPTREAIDSVRYLSNRSSGKMGFALATAAQAAGAKVILVAGPVSLRTPADVRRVDVESAAEMFDAVHASLDTVDIFIGAAAVADYRPEEARSGKIKKNAARLSVELVRNADILTSVAQAPQRPFTVGFAAETDNLLDYARGKLQRKSVDMIVANLVGDNKGFDVDTNAAVVIWRDGQQSFPETQKTRLARDLLDCIAKRFNEPAAVDTQTELPAIATLIRD